MWVLHVFVSLISEEVSEGKADLHVSKQYDSLLGSQGALRSPKHQQGCQGKLEKLLSFLPRLVTNCFCLAQCLSIVSVL